MVTNTVNESTFYVRTLRQQIVFALLEKIEDGVRFHAPSLVQNAEIILEYLQKDFEPSSALSQQEGTDDTKSGSPQS